VNPAYLEVVMRIVREVVLWLVCAAVPLLAVMGLSGCATRAPVTVEVPVRSTPPEALMMPGSIPSRSYQTNRELIEWCEDVLEAAQDCEADRAAIRSWADSPAKLNQKI
jgi:hypothetical protein